MAEAGNVPGRRLVRIRIACQVAAFAAFAVFTLRPELHAGGEWLFRIDASNVLLASLAAHRMSVTVLLSAALLGVTLVFGRVFCGWVCPLGGLGDALDAVWRMPIRGERFGWIKYGLLVVFVVLALGGHLLAWLFDPMVWASHLLTLPFFRYVDLRAALVLAVAFVGIHALFGRRAFCRILCPLGAMLGVVARFATLRRRLRTHACIDCDLCVDHNRSAAIRPGPADYNPMECFQCGECRAVCPTDALAFEYVLPARRPAADDVVHVPLAALLRSRKAKAPAAVPQRAGATGPVVTRRQLLGSTAAGVAGVVWLRAEPAGAAAAAAPLRPPGAVAEEDFVDLCIRCTACMRACPTETLRPAGLDQGLAGYRAPVLSARDGGCEHGCTACGQVCPTGAIEPLALLRKQTLQLGIARVDESLCIPLRDGRPCMSCSAACPYEAIDVEPLPKTLEWGDRLTRPRVVESACTGCGLCEAACPVSGAAAIRIEPLAQQRPLAPVEGPRPFRTAGHGAFRIDPTLLDAHGLELPGAGK